MWVWLAGLLGFVVGWLVCKWGSSTVLADTELARDTYRSNMRGFESQYNDLRLVNVNLLEDRDELETRNMRARQILNGVPLNEIQ